MVAADTIATLSERITRLEEAERTRPAPPDATADAGQAEIATKLAAVDATLPFLATKSDISDVRTEIADVRTEISAVRTENAKGQTSMIRWFVGTTITIIAVAVTLFRIIIGLIVTRLP